MRILSIAATGMNAQQTNVEVVANNIANANTTGFKRSRAEFTDLLYQMQKASSVSQSPDTNLVPEGAELGLGVKLSAIRSIQLQGPLAKTGNQLDIAVNGAGWLPITGPGGTTVYTRAGSLNTDANGQIVNADGYALSPSITVPALTTAVTISNTGQVFAQVSGNATPQSIGQITLANFANASGLKPLGNNLFGVTSASGAAVTGKPGDPSFGTISQGYLEQSNVDPVQEITDLISAQRVYELNSKVIQAADDMSSLITKGMH